MYDVTPAVALETAACGTNASETPAESTAEIRADAAAVTAVDLLRSWRRRDLDEARARYDEVAGAAPAGRRGIHRRLIAALGDGLIRRALPLAAYGHRRPPDQIVAQLLDAHLLDEEFRP